MTTFELQNAVFIQNQEIKTDSLKVAEVFIKRHDHVLRKIENILSTKSTDPNFGVSKFMKHNFILSSYFDKSGRALPMFEMTKDGFIFLAMGFTGEEAAITKIAYIHAFNQMAEVLHKQQNQIQTIDVGSVVRLRSGSPDLTINHIFDDVAEVIWFRGGRIVREQLPLSCLTLGESDRLAPSVSHTLDTFWSNLYGYGVHNLNHSNRADQIALNISQVMDIFPQLFSRNDLLQNLPHSKPPYPQYVEHNVPMQSRLERKTVRCWIFQVNHPTMIDVKK